MDDIIQSVRQLIGSGNLDEAECVLNDALQQNPDSQELLTLHAELSLKLGTTFWEKGDVEKALELKTLLLLFFKYIQGGVVNKDFSKSLFKCQKTILKPLKVCLCHPGERIN
jgi:hypothetical protein